MPSPLAKRYVPIACQCLDAVTPATQEPTIVICGTGVADSFQKTAEISPIAQEVEQALRSIYTTSLYSSPEESAREMRFAMRLIVIRWVDLINQGATVRSSFWKEAMNAVDVNHTGVANIRTTAVRSIGSILKGSEWDMNSRGEDGRYLPDDQQAANKTIHGIIEGMKRINAEINALLERHGSVEVEFEDPESEEDEEEDEEEVENEDGGQDDGSANPHPPPRLTVPSQVASLLTPQRGSATTLVGKKLKWTDEENDALVQVWKDMPNATKNAITAEHNRRMRASREAAGSTIHYDRTMQALRHQLNDVLKTRGLI